MTIITKPGTASTYSAQAQTLLGRFPVFGGGFSIGKYQSEPYRVIDGSEIYITARNDAPHDRVFDRSKLKLWGKFYHPYLMNGMPGAGGWTKLYVEKIYSHYLLWISSKLDSDMVGPSDWVNELCAWTPNEPGLSIVKAGYKMFYAQALYMDGLEEDQYYSKSYDEDSNWQRDWDFSERCFQVFAGIRKTKFSDDKDFQEFIIKSPIFLKEHLLKCRIPT